MTLEKEKIEEFMKIDKKNDLVRHPFYRMRADEQFVVDYKMEDALRTIITRDFPKLRFHIYISAGDYTRHNLKVLTIRFMDYDFTNKIFVLLSMSFTSDTVTKLLPDDMDQWYFDLHEVRVEEMRTKTETEENDDATVSKRFASYCCNFAYHNKFKYALSNFILISGSTVETAMINELVRQAGNMPSKDLDGKIDEFMNEFVKAK